MNWNDTTYTDTVAKHPVLDSKPESVALAVWALARDKDITPQGWRDLSEKTGVKVAGRAVGSARKILGLHAAKEKAPARRRGRPKGSRNGVRRSPGRPRKVVGNPDAVTELVATITKLQRERNEAVSVLEKIRRCLD